MNRTKNTDRGYHVRTFRHPKDDRYPMDYEDVSSFDLQLGRLAIADGAGESSFAREWAELLVTEFVAGSPRLPLADPTDLQSWVARLQARMRDSIPRSDLAWFADEKARAGAFSTFLGVQLDSCVAGPGPRQLHALAIGDSCLFQLREGRIVSGFPLSSAGLFAISPVLLSSNPESNTPVWSRVQQMSSRWRSADHLLMMTDALAQWFLAQCETGARPLEVLDRRSSDFAPFVRELQANRSLRADDITLLWISARRPKGHRRR